MSELLEVKNLVIEYRTDDGVVHALNDVSFSIGEGKTLGLVGETGAGKTTLAKGIIRLIQSPPGKIVQGQVLYNGKDLIGMTDVEIRGIRGFDISMIFQDPMTSLNPVMTVGKQIQEVIDAHNKLSPEESWKKVLESLELVGIPAERANNYPHQFSGGMKQRVIIAIALACKPKLLIADEPTTALDVTIQAQVLRMITDLKKKLNTAMLLITHDLGVVAQNCDDVAVIYAGEIVEYGSVREIFHEMKHPYTLGLMASIPSLEKKVNRLQSISGLMPDPSNLPAGCKFAARCPYKTDICETKLPDLETISERHDVRCHHWAEIAGGRKW
ncbi:ABC transporter ATP-binding protein [Clostridiaceae bacterium HFYG-1003]|nr:ABC transporter ATP-binding protein [Clostridiaceae bacterium HFYG-1003]